MERGVNGLGVRLDTEGRAESRAIQALIGNNYYHFVTKNIYAQYETVFLLFTCYRHAFTLCTGGTINTTTSVTRLLYVPVFTLCD